MAWFYLLIAAAFEIAWPMGLKMSTNPSQRIPGIVLAVVALALSSLFLWLAQRVIPIGTAYAVWTGIGAAGTLFAGVIFWNDPLTLWRVVGVMLIVGGVVILRLTAQPM